MRARVRITSADPKQLERLLPGLPLAGVEELAVGARQITYRAGETVMGEREPWTPAVVMDGTVRLAIRSHDGREATLRLIGRGVMVGLVALFDPRYTSPIHDRSMVAVEPATVVFFDPPVLMRLCHQHAAFTVHLLRGTVDWGGALSDAAGRYVFLTVLQRVAGYLLNIAVEDGSGELVARITQQQLANSVGSVREVVARTLHDLRSDGLISVSRGRIAVLDRDGLMRSAYDVT